MCNDGLTVSFDSSAPTGNNNSTARRGKGRGKGQRFGHRSQGHTCSFERLRAAILELRKCHEIGPASIASKELKAALLAAEEADGPVDGPLIGMAAAHARRLGLQDVIEALCAFAWCRLSQCGGREVAELSTAAAHMNCEDQIFFSQAATYCFKQPNAFASLRDISLMSTALLKRSSKHRQNGRGPAPFDLALAFSGLSAAAVKELQHAIAAQSFVTRDASEFIYALSQMLQTQPLTGGPPLCQTQVAKEALVLSIKFLRRSLHMASPQDIAKFSGGVSTAWPLFVNLQNSTLKPCISDVAQAVRFNCDKFNLQDLSLTVFAFAKFDSIDDVVTDILCEQVASRISDFSQKDICLMLWVAAHAAWAKDNWVRPIVGEVSKRDLSSFSEQDLCMATQALARIGEEGKALLCLCFDEVFNRQLINFSATDKCFLLWAVAKSKVVHLALCRQIIRSLTVGNLIVGAPQNALNALLWALAVLYPSIKLWEDWLAKLVGALCEAAPWNNNSSYEVANAAWAFGYLEAFVKLEDWANLAEKANAIGLPEMSLHSLCNLLHGFAVCPAYVDKRADLMARFAREVISRISSEKDMSTHDTMTLSNMLSRMQTPLPAELQELSDRVSQYSVPESTKSSQANQANSETSDASDWFDLSLNKHGKVIADGKEHRVVQKLDLHCTTFRKRECHSEGDATLLVPTEHGVCEVTACSASCCPRLLPDDSNSARLNTHCAFQGHCVQLKNTFIHVECSSKHDDDQDCSICRMSRGRSRSCDAIRLSHDDDSVPDVLYFPPLTAPDAQSAAAVADGESEKSDSSNNSQ